jgi:16S rRNA G1207 methylase RsmC
MAKSSQGTLVEIMPDNVAHLNTNFELPLLTKDFLSCTEAELGGKFDKFIANPPFTKNQDIHHFLHMVELLNDNGRVVCITSSHWEHSKTHLCQAFKAWLKHCGAKVTIIKAGTFKSSGTSIETRRIVLDKASVSISFEDFSKQYKLDTAA